AAEERARRRPARAGGSRAAPDGPRAAPAGLGGRAGIRLPSGDRLPRGPAGRGADRTRGLPAVAVRVGLPAGGPRALQPGGGALRGREGDDRAGRGRASARDRGDRADRHGRRAPQRAPRPDAELAPPLALPLGLPRARGHGGRRPPARARKLGDGAPLRARRRRLLPDDRRRPRARSPAPPAAVLVARPDLGAARARPQPYARLARTPVGGRRLGLPTRPRGGGGVG